ncbi:MAG: kelch repeat-containing protein [Planctomycetota bacterium]|nr:kelch repeat-containing protein [Planctomycetota bacterium]
MRINRITALTAGALAAVCISPALAQGDFDYDSSSPATFGKTLKLDYKGAPAGKPMMFMLSLNGGPVPLKLMFGGNDPRSISVGVDLVAAWLLIGTGPGGGSIPVLVPTLPALAGMHLHLQMMTGGGSGPHIIDKLSNKIVVIPGPASTTTTLQAQLGDGRSPRGPGRAMMAVFPIPNSKGKFMLAGGGTGNILGANGLKTTEIFDSRTNTVKPGPDMNMARALATFTQLKDGRVLLAGGVDTVGDPTNTCEIYNPATNTFTSTGSMGSKRAGHAAALLNDGRVLVVAGTRELKDVAKAITGLLSSAEIYNPATGNWSGTGSIANAVLGPSLTTLTNGKVLVAGGARVNTIFGIPLSVTSLNTCQLYNPSSGSWSGTGSMRNDRAVHSFDTLRLSNGRVLVTGGVKVNIAPLIPPPANFAGATAMKQCEYYDPNSGSWVSLPDMSIERTGHSVTQTRSGIVIIAGGAKGAIDAAISTTSIQEFNPSSNSFVGSYNMKTQRATQGSALTPSGAIVLFGGTISSTATTTLHSIEMIHR